LKVHKKKKPRIFLVSKKNKIYLKDVGKINLENNENLTITSNNKKNYEICRKDWGYYATPSINERLKKNGFKTALVKQKKKYFILLVDKRKIRSFNNYCKIESYKIIKWLDRLS
tara:strand:- start:7462 stop:7803 length:342 start_codon:yes stop_codon:yes gene_type:complete